MNRLFNVVEELFGCFCMPDARLERSPILQLDFLGTRFLGIRVECILYLINDRYIGDGGSLCVRSSLALLIFEPLKYPASLGHFLEVTGKSGVSQEQFLEKTFCWGLHESFVRRYVLLEVLRSSGDGDDALGV